MDATLFAVNNFSEVMKDYGFFSCRRNPYGFGLTQRRWTNFFLACGENNIIPNFCKDIYLNFWEQHDSIIDYFFVDYNLDMAYRLLPGAREMIDALPLSNPNIMDMQEKLNEPFDACEWDEFSDYNSLYKFTYKGQFIEKVDGNETLYGFITHLS